MDDISNGDDSVVRVADGLSAALWWLQRDREKVRQVIAEEFAEFDRRIAEGDVMASFMHLLKSKL